MQRKESGKGFSCFRLVQMTPEREREEKRTSTASDGQRTTHGIDALLVCFCNTMTEKHPHV